MNTITRKNQDVEKLELPPSRIESFSGSDEIPVNRFWWRNLISRGVEVQGIQPIPAQNRIDTRIVNLFSIWFAMMISPLTYGFGFLSLFRY